MDTLVVEKALQDVRGLQGELAAFGVIVELEDSDADGTVAAVHIPSLYGETEQTIQLDGRVCERGHQAETLEGYRLRVISHLADYCEQEAKDLPSKWAALCGGETVPLPDNLKTRRRTLEDTAVKLRGLLSGDPHALGEDGLTLLGKPVPPHVHTSVPRRLGPRRQSVRSLSASDACACVAAVPCLSLAGVHGLWTLSPCSVRFVMRP